VSEKAKRGPLDPDTWMNTHKPIMTAYKFVTVDLSNVLHVTPYSIFC